MQSNSIGNLLGGIDMIKGHPNLRIVFPST
jgi:hypothetical protein